LLRLHRSITIAMPWPTPDTHRDERVFATGACQLARRGQGDARTPRHRAGDPIAIAPPFGLTRLSPKSTSRPRRQAKTCAANASLISMTSTSFSVTPARSSAFFAAGPDRSHDGAARPRRPRSTGWRAIGWAPAASPALRAGDDHRDRAVIDARGVAGGGDAILEQRTQLASAAMSVCGRGCSSSATLTGPDRPPGTSTAMISSA